MNIWYTAFIKGIPNIPWKTYEDKFLPVIYNIGAGETAEVIVSHFIRASSCIAAKENMLNGNLLKCYLQLLSDPNSSILRGTLSNLCELLNVITPELAEKEFLPRV